jgi:hypothetical protein
MRLAVRHIGLIAFVGAAVLTLTCVTQTASSATCGETPAGASKAVKATAELDASKSNVTKPFGKDTDPEEMSMFFTTSGCDLPKNPANPELTPVALKDSKNIPQDTLTPISTRTTGGNELVVRISADPDKFKPGTYTSLVLVDADYLKTVSVTVQVSRSDPHYVKVGLLGAAIGLLVFVIVTLGAWATGQLALSGLRLLAACVLVIITAVVAAMSNYWPQSVWTRDENLAGFAAAVFAAATTCSIAGHITGKGNDNGGNDGNGDNGDGDGDADEDRAEPAAP